MTALPEETLTGPDQVLASLTKAYEELEVFLPEVKDGEQYIPTSDQARLIAKMNALDYGRLVLLGSLEDHATTKEAYLSVISELVDEVTARENHDSDYSHGTSQGYNMVIVLLQLALGD